MDKKFSEFVINEIALRFKCEKEQVHTVWQCKTLQNIKGLFFCTAESANGLYFEAIYSGLNNQLYLDTYTKLRNEEINVDF